MTIEQEKSFYIRALEKQGFDRDTALKMSESYICSSKEFSRNTDAVRIEKSLDKLDNLFETSVKTKSNAEKIAGLDVKNPNSPEERIKNKAKQLGKKIKNIAAKKVRKVTNVINPVHQLKKVGGMITDPIKKEAKKLGNEFNNVVKTATLQNAINQAKDEFNNVKSQLNPANLAPNDPLSPIANKIKNVARASSNLIHGSNEDNIKALENIKKQQNGLERSKKHLDPSRHAEVDEKLKKLSSFRKETLGKPSFRKNAIQYYKDRINKAKFDLQRKAFNNRLKGKPVPSDKHIKSMEQELMDLQAGK